MPSPVSVPEYNTQFLPRSDDDDTLWAVQEIVKEDKHRYLVKWEGVDSKTGKPWDLSWVPKHDCTDDLIHEWKTTKAKKAQRGKKKRKKQSSTSKVDPDYNPTTKKSSISSRDNSHPESTPRSSNNHNPPSAGPSRHSITPKGNISPFVDVPRVKKRQRERTGSTGEVEAEPPKNKKRKLTSVEPNGIASIKSPNPQTNRGSPIKKSSHFQPLERLPGVGSSPLRRPTARKDDASEDAEEEEDSLMRPKHHKRPSLPPPYTQPNQNSYEIDPHRKIGKRRVVVSSQESDAPAGLHATTSDQQDHDMVTHEDDEPVERTSRDFAHHVYRDSDLGLAYEYGDAHIDDLDGGIGGMFDGEDDAPQDLGPVQAPLRSPTPSPLPSSRSPSPPSPHALLRMHGTEAVIPETQLTPSSQSQPQSAKRSPAKPPFLITKVNPAFPSPASSPRQSFPLSKVKSTSDASPLPRRDAGSSKSNALFPIMSPSKPDTSRALHPVLTISPSRFKPYLIPRSLPASQLSSIDTFTSPSKSQRKGRALLENGDLVKEGEKGKGRRLAYSQREEEEESGSEDERPGNEKEEEDEIVDDDSLLDEALQRRGEELLQTEEERKRVAKERDTKLIKRSLSKVLSDHKRARSVSTATNGEADDANNAVRSREATSSSSVDSIHRGVVKPSSNKVAQWWSKSSSASDDAVQDDQTQIASNEATEMDQGGEHGPAAQADELGPDDAPDAHGLLPPDSGSFPLQDSGEVNFSLEATAPWTQSSQQQPHLPRVIKSPTKQLDSALGLLNRKSEEIQELREAVEVAHGRTATLEHEMKTLQTRLAATEKRYGEVSAALDMERIKQRYSATPAVDVAENVRLLEENARLLQDNERLKAANVQLENDASVLREVYNQASDSHKAILAENRAFERDNQSLKVQASTGVKQANTFWESQVRKMELELERSRGTVKVLTDQAQRTGDDLRKRAALLPMVQQEVEEARTEVEEWMEKVRELGRENTRLRVEVKGWEDDAMARRREQEAERERRMEAEAEAAAEGETGADDLVWVCPWMDAEHKNRCAALLDSHEKLREHLYEAGHI